MQNQLDVSVDCVLFGFDGEGLKVLLIEQGLDESGSLSKDQVQTALPGDLVYLDESLDASAERVLKELTSLDGIYLKQFHTFGDPQRVKGLKDQDWLRSFRANPERRVITVAYYSLVKMEDYQPQPSSFAGKAIWVDVNEIPDLAFDHNDIAEKALTVLREELDSKHIGFELLPEKFTLSQLQLLYEIILDKKLDKRNFRKNIKKMDQVIPLDEKQQGVLHKPAQLFRFDKENPED
ncbi:MAG: NUDIX hydrolase [Flavobacteriales bacterium]|nr:NUDIX hydrolase [Flavobacteriales bacterium]MDG1781917.1 NUDIX hydrolase [Flavobacteriales bacterium]